MEKLQKRSDGFFETQSGLLGVKPLRYRLETSTYREFSFKTHPTEPSIVVRWRKEDQIAVIDAEVAKTMLNLGYAGHVTEELAERWNAFVDELELDAPAPEGNEPPKGEAEPTKVEPEQEQPEPAAGAQGEASNASEAGTEGNATESGGEQSKEPEKEADEASETETQTDASEAKSAGKAKKGSLV